MATIHVQLTKGLYALVEADDAVIVAQHKWHAKKSSANWYAATNVRVGEKRVRLKMHKLIMQTSKIVDHINGDSLDNRRANLRICTIAENNRNAAKRARGWSRFKGVSFKSDRGKWSAHICANGVRRYLGQFATEHEAALAYDRACRRYHGSFARVNFPTAGEELAIAVK